ncbi:hypothetical protein RSAG8_05844, partial [Rhizoctonia solani AG-8 WAC10335]
MPWAQLVQNTCVFDLSGSSSTDTVTVAGLAATNQYFSGVTSESEGFASDLSDDLVGLALSFISQIGQLRFTGVLTSLT